LIASQTRPFAPLNEPDAPGLDLDDPYIGPLGEPKTIESLWLGRAAPRYTSYPSATSFHEGITAQDYASALAVLPQEEPVSLYLHIPFCQSLCLYCGCNSTATQKYERVSHYMDYLHRELELIARSAGTPRKVRQVHFGGGSPNILSEKNLGLLFGILARHYDLGACEEVSMELDPRLITKAQARVLALLGVNRVSLGIQDFDPEVQYAIGRAQSYERVREACDTLRQAGIYAINFDMMYGLPRQTPQSIELTAQEALTLHPSRLALFSYAHMPTFKPHQKALEASVLPDPQTCLTLEQTARQIFVQAGFCEIGIDHFAHSTDPLSLAAKEKTLRRNFQGYTANQAPTLLGIGASAISFLGGNYYQNARKDSSYENALRQNGFATARGLRTSGEDHLRAAIIEQLMCHMTVNLETTCRQHDFSLTVLRPSLEALEPFIQSGLIAKDGYKITLTTPHRMAVRVIASLFDRYFDPAKTPASKVV